MALETFTDRLQMMVCMSALAADVTYTEFTICPTGITVYVLHASQVVALVGVLIGVGWYIVVM